MADKTNAEILYDGLVSNPKIKGLPTTFDEFNTTVLQNPDNAKMLYDGLSKNPSIKGLPTTFDSFQKTIMPPVDIKATTASKPVSTPKIDGPVGDPITQAMSFISDLFKSPLKTDVSTAEKQISEAGTPPPSVAQTPEAESSTLLQNSNKKFNVVKSKLQTQYPGMDELKLNSLAVEELQQLGYRYKDITLPNGKKDYVWAPVPDFKVDEAWLQKQRESIWNNYTKISENIDKTPDGKLVSAYTGFKNTFAPTFLKQALDKLDGDEPETLRLKEQHANADKFNKDVSELYTAAKVKPRAINYNGLEKIDYADPESYAAIDEETQLIANSIPKTAQEKVFLKTKFQENGVDLDYYDKPFLGDQKKSHHVFNPDEDQATDLESQMFYSKGLAFEKSALRQNIDGYQRTVDQLDANISKIQDSIAKKGYQADSKALLDKNLALKSKLETNIKAKNGLLNYYEGEEKGLNVYKDYLSEKAKIDRLSETSPYLTAGVYIAKHLLELPSGATGLTSKLAARVMYGEEGAISLAEQSSSVSKGGVWDYFAGKGVAGPMRYTGIVPEGIYEGTEGQQERTSIEGATTLSLIDKDGNWKVTYNSQPIIYQTGRVAIDSYLLGKAMFSTSEFYAPMKAAWQAEKLAAEAALEEATANSLIAGGEGAGAFSGLGSYSATGASLRAANIYARETLVGSVAPSIIMFGDKMLKDELDKGLSFDQALLVGTMRASIEGLTERIFPNEMEFYKALSGKGVFRSYAQLAENAGYRTALSQAFEKKFGKSISDFALNYILNPSKAAASVWAEEGMEEVAGLLMGEFPNKVAQTFKPDYKISETFSADAAWNTMASTMATMLPMGGTAGVHNIREYSDTQLDSKISVGRTPSPYIKAVQDMQKEGVISKEEADRRMNYINRLQTIGQKVETLAPGSKNYEKLTTEQQDFHKRELFKKLIEQEQLQEAITTAPTDAEKLKIADSMQESILSMKTLLEQGAFKTEAERVDNTINSLKFYTSDDAIKTSNNVKSLQGIAQTLLRYSIAETDKKAKEAYKERVAKIGERIAQINKEAIEAAKSPAEKAKANNEKGKVTIQRPGIGALDLELNTPYYLSTVDDVSVEGKKIVKRPEIKIIADNGDGTLVITSDGETQTITVADLANFKFTRKTNVEKWRKEKNPRAFVFDNENNVFSYEFAKETPERGKVVNGRITFNPTSNAVELKYKNAKGEVVTQVLDKSDLNAFKTNKGRLKLVRGLLTEAEYNDRLAKAKKSADNANFDMLQNQAFRRFAFITEYIESKKNSLKALKDTISKSEDYILDIEIEMEKLQAQLDSKEKTYTVKRALRVDVKKLLDRLITLKDMHVKINGSIDELRLEQADLEAEIDYLNRYEDEQQFAPGKSLSEQFLDDWINLNEQKDKIQGVIADLNRVANSIQDLITKTVNVINGLITDFSNKYGAERIALTLDAVYDVIGVDREVVKTYGEQASFMKKHPNYIDDVDAFQTILDENLNNLDANEHSLENVKKSINANISLVKKLAEEIGFQEDLIKAAEDAEKKFKTETFSKKVKSLAEKIFKTFSDNQSNNQTNDPTEDDEASTESPKIELRDLFTATTGVSDLDQPEVNNIQNFLNTVENTSAYSLLVVTKDNAEKYGLKDLIFTGNGITNDDEDQSKNHIVLVVTKKVGDTTTFVDRDGKNLTTVNKDNVVYTSMRMARLTWQDGGANFVDKETDLKDAALLAKAEPYRLAHEKFRQLLIDAVKKGEQPLLSIKGISRGFSTQRFNTPYPVTTALALPSTLNLANTQVIQVATSPDNKSKTGEVPYQGTNSNIRMPKGRPILSFGQHFQFLNNRRFDSKDVVKYQRIFKYLYDNITDAAIVEKVDKFLAKTLYVRDPGNVSNLTDKAQESAIGRSQIWMSKEEGNLVLHLRDLSIPFNFEEGVVAPYFALEAFFTGQDGKGVYHNVDAKDLVGKEFSEFYLEGNTVKERLWPSYQSYLLSDKYPTGGNRPLEEIPLTTNLTPSTATTPNKTGRYIVYSNPLNEKVTTSAPKVATKAPAPATKPTGQAATYDSPGGTLISVKDIGPANREYVGTNYIWEFREDPSSKTPTYSIAFTKSNGQFVILQSEGIPPQFNKAQVLKSLTKAIADNQDNQSLKVTVWKSTTDEPQNEPEPTQEAPTTEPEVKTETPTTTTTGRPDLASILARKKAAGKTGSSKEFRIAKREAGYKQENLKAAKDWWEARFPQIPFRIVSGLVDGVAWGAISDAMVTISNIAEEGTIYHEAFEAVNKYFLTSNEQSALRREFRLRQGNFIEYATGKTVPYSEATDSQIKEQLSEEYRDYEISRGEKVFTGQTNKSSLFRQIYDFIHNFLFGSPANIQETFERISSAKYKDKIPNAVQTVTDYRLALQIENPVLFRQMMNSMTNLLFQDLKDKNIGLMDFLASSVDTVASRYNQVRADVNLFYGGSDMVDMFDAFGSKDAYMEALADPDFYVEFFEAFSVLASDKFQENFIRKYGINPTDEALKNLYDIIQNYKYLRNNWSGMVGAHKKFLSAYKIEFEEDDNANPIEEQNDNEDANRNDYSPNQLTFSVKQNANAEVKMLIATLIRREFSKSYVPIEGISPTEEDMPSYLNDMLMSELVDYGAMIGQLLHKLAHTNNFDEMVTVIRRESMYDPSYIGLLRKLQVDKDLSQLSLEEGEYVVDLRNKFFTSLNNMKADTIVLILNPEDLSGSSIDVNDANAVRIVKSKWLNALKSSPAVKVKGEELVINKAALGATSISKERDIMSFLGALGFDFNIPFERLTKDEVTSVMESARSLHKVLVSSKPDAILYDNKLTSTALTRLAEVYIKYSDFYSEAQHLNIEGQPVQNVILHNFIGIITKIFNGSRTLDDLVKSIPQYTQSKEDNPYISSSQILNKGSLFFDTEGNRTRNITVRILEGARVREEATGIPTSALAKSDFIAQEFSHNLNGDYYILVPADAKTEWGLSLGHFATQQQVLNKGYVADIMKKHLAAEILTAQRSKFSTDRNVRNAGLKLRQFEGILKSADPEFKLPLTYDKSPEQIIAENIFKIDEAIARYFDNKVNNLFNYFTENNVITPYRNNTDGSSSIEIVGSEKEEDKFTILFSPRSFIDGGLTLAQIRDLIRFREINYELAMIEQHKILWGDPAQWKDPTKRTKSFMSGRNISVNGNPYFNQWHNTNSNKKTYSVNGVIETVVLQPGDIGYINYDDLLRVQSYEDVISIAEQAQQLFDNLLNQNALDVFDKNYSELTEEEQTSILDFYNNDSGELENPYESNNEADAQAWSFPAGYQEIRRRANTWTKAEEEQYEWDMALFRKDNNFYPEGERGDSLRAYDNSLIAIGNPYINRAKAGQALPIQQVLKPIYSGFKEGKTLSQDIRKMSIANLNWRLVKGTAMEPMYIAHVKKNTTFINMESANKVGLPVHMEPMYVDGVANTTVDTELLNFKYFGIQVETKTQKDKSTLGTQLTKLATLNLMISGMPLDFIRENKGLDKRELTKKWNSLTEAEKMATSRHYTYSRRNGKLLAAMKILAKETVFKEFGLEEREVNGNRVLEFTNIEKFEGMLQRELNNRDAPENIKDAAVLVPDENGNLIFQVPLDLQIGADKLESIITSIIDKRLLRPKMFGGQMPQIASTLLESKEHKRELVYKNSKGKYVTVQDLSKLNADQKKTVRVTSNELKWYTKEEPWIEVMLPFYMQELIEKGTELKVSDIKDKELLWGIGFRIPTQELNSVEHIKIKGFLPAEYGNSIVVPTEITTKAGSDFDIDKLNIYLYNYVVENGQPTKIKYLDNSNSTLEQRYENKFGKDYFYDFLNTAEGYAKYKRGRTLYASNKLINAIFDEDLELDGALDLSKTYEENLEKAKKAMEEEKAKLMPIAEFGRLPMELQNTKEAIENGYIDNLRDLVSLEDNFAQLTQPNSAVILRREAVDMNILWKNKSAKKTFSSYLDSLQNASTRIAFLVGKAGVGIGAASQTLHAISQLIGAEFSETVEDNLKFNFPTNSYVDEQNGLRHYDVGAKLTTDKKPISSIISAFINAFVDVAKDPFILDINGNTTTAGIYITAFKLGMPVKETIRWFSQPVIKDYIAMVQKSKSVSAQLTDTAYSKTEILDILGHKYGFKTLGYKIAKTDRTGNYTTSELEGYIREWVAYGEEVLDTNDDGDVIGDRSLELTQEFKDNQGNLLAEFLKLEGISWDLFRLGQALNHDTSRTVNFDSIRNKVADVVKGLNSPFKESIIRALEDTFIGTIFTGKNELLAGMQPLYLTERSKARQILNPIMTSIFLGKGSKDMKETIAKDMRKEFINYLLQTIPVSIAGKEKALLNSAIKELFINAENLPKKLRAIQEKQQTGELPENFLTKNLFSVFPLLVEKAGNLKNIQLLRRMTDKVDSDLATSDWSNLGNHPLTQGFMYDLVRFALLQSGIKGGPNSFSHLIPNSIFADIARQLDDYFDKTEINTILAGFEDSFYRNNWWNRGLIPKAKIKSTTFEDKVTGLPVTFSNLKPMLKGLPNVILYWAEPQAGETDYKPGQFTRRKYLFHQEMRKDAEGTPLFDKAQREEMVKKGDFSFMNRTLYKRVEVLNPLTGKMDVPLFKDGTGRYAANHVMFYPVAMYGKRGELLEHYSMPSLSTVNPGPTPLSDQEVFDRMLAAGRGSDRFLSNILGVRPDEEDVTLSLDETLYKEMEESARVSARKNLVLFESSKTAKEIANEEDWQNTKNNSQNPLDCE